MDEQISPDFKLFYQSTRNGTYLIENADRLLREYERKKNYPQGELTLSLFKTNKGLNFKSSKIFMGPSPQYRLVSIFRRIAKTNSNKNPYEINYYCLQLVDFSSPNLDAQILMQFIDDSTNRLRDVVINPDGHQMLMIYEQNVVKYHIYKKEANSSVYEVKQVKKRDFPTIIQSTNTVNHPSGKYVFGITYEEVIQISFKQKTVYSKSPNIFKIFYDSLQIFVNVDVDLQQKLCVDFNYFHPMSDWNLAIDSNFGNVAFMAANGDYICMFDTSQLWVQQQIVGTRTKFYKTIPNSQVTSYDPYSQSLGILNSTSSSHNFFSIYTYERNIAHQVLYQQQKYLQLRRYRLIPRSSIRVPMEQFSFRCVDIPDINAFACYKQVYGSIYFSKIYDPADTIHHLGAIRLSEQQYSPLKSTIIEDIIYYPPASQFCAFLNSSFYCFQLSTNCSKNEQKTPINKCSYGCQKQTEFWNPMPMKCQKCTNSSCSCSNQKHSYNSYQRGCRLNCSLIKYATHESEYENYSKCLCYPPFSWFEDMKICRYNCSLINNTQAVVDYKKLRIDQCVCQEKYSYFNSTQYGKLGYCHLICGNGKKAEIINEEMICRCNNVGQIWDTDTLTCRLQVQIKNIKEQTKQKMLLPIWAIAIIAIVGALTVAIIAFCLYKNCCKRKKPVNQSQFENKNPTETESAKQSDRVLKLSNKNSQRNSSSQLSQGNKTENQNKCFVCKNQQMPTNVSGPCGHLYHFQCIKKKIQENEAQCPQCFIVFHKGIQDLKVHSKQQGFSIGDEN